MGIIDDKGRLFGLINLIDLGVIVLIAALIFGIYSKAKNITRPQAVDVEVEVLANKVRPEIATQVKPGDQLIAGGNLVPMDLVDVKVSPARISYAVPQGGPELASGLDPELKDVRMIIRGTSRSQTIDLNLFGQELKAGRPFWVKSQTYQLEATQTRVTVLETR